MGKVGLLCVFPLVVGTKSDATGKSSLSVVIKSHVDDDDFDKHNITQMIYKEIIGSLPTCKQATVCIFDSRRSSLQSKWLCSFDAPKLYDENGEIVVWSLSQKISQQVWVCRGEDVRSFGTSSSFLTIL